MIEISGIDWDQNEKLDVTLERPDVTLYGLIELPVCHFVCLSVWLFLLGCACVTECLPLRLLLFLRTVFSPCQSVILLHRQRCVF